VSISERVEAATAALGEWLPERPVAYIVLGSGLGRLTDLVASPIELPFRDVPGLPVATVAGHAGKFVAGRLGGLPVLIQAGRPHGYEGHPREVVGLAVQAAARAGARFGVLTNSVGALRPGSGPGTLALLADLLDLRAPDPRGRPPRSLGGASREPRSPAPRATFDPALSALVEDAAVELGISLPRAVYASVTGPSYETPAEVRMLRRLGADLVAMSVVAELESAAEAGLPVVGISVVSNLASGLSGERPQHAEVVEAGGRAASALGRLIVRVLERVARGGFSRVAPDLRRDQGATGRNG